MEGKKPSSLGRVHGVGFDGIGPPRLQTHPALCTRREEPRPLLLLLLGEEPAETALLPGGEPVGALVVHGQGLGGLAAVEARRGLRLVLGMNE